MTRRLYDISPAIGPGIPVWPGDTEFTETRNWEIGPDCPVNVSLFTMSTHTGSHADAPFHYDADGKRTGGLDLERYLGPCRVVHALDATTHVEPRHVEGHLHDVPPRLLFRTYETAPQDRWDPAFTAIHHETVETLARAGVLLVGLDTPSLDPQESKTMDAHMAVRRNGMSILESLVLDGVPEGDYELIALPLKLANLDAAPVRAVLRPLG